MRRRWLTLVPWLLVGVLLLWQRPSAQVNNPVTMNVQDEGVSQGRVTQINFTGSAVACSVSGFTATCNVTGGAAAVTTVTLCCLGAGMARYTIADVNVGFNSKIVATVDRSNVADVDDHGWIFVANIVTVANASFDVLVIVVDPSAGPGDESLITDPPTGTFKLNYVVG